MVNTPIKAQQVALCELSEDMRATRPGYQWSLDMERARLLTESYKQTEGQPMALRRAKALAHILENMTVYIRPDELIVGNYASNVDSVSFYPEFAWKWIVRETEPGKIYDSMVTDEGRKELKEICSYWGDNSIHHKLRKYLPEELTDIFWVFNWESTTPNYEKTLAIGMKGILEEAKERLKKLDEEYMAETINGIDFVRKKDFLNSTIITIEAMINWAKRYAKLAWDMARSEENPVRREELETIARTCEWVPENPARTLFEALQCYWFIHLIVNFIELPQVGSGIRFDQVFNHFYEKDVTVGTINREQVQELVECVIVKFQETGFLHAPLWSGFGGGALGFQTITVGGVDAQGNDITNEMSYIVLDAVKTVRAIVPPLALRWHDRMPQKLVHKAIEVMASGMPQPAIFNDKVNVLRLVAMGCSLEDANNYSINNCMVPTIPGKNFNHVSAWANGIPVPVCLNTALGIAPLAMYKKAGPKTIDPANLSSAEELVDATMDNYRWLVHKLVQIANIMDALYREYAPRPFLSSVIDDCIERAQDVRDWNYTPDYRDFNVFGLNTVADSIAAVKKLAATMMTTWI
jgi:formate C-acetyltransferase